MKKIINYSQLMILFSLLIFSCSKEEEVNPTATLQESSTSNTEVDYCKIGGYKIGCLNYYDGKWSFEVKKDYYAKEIYHLSLKLYNCKKEPVKLDNYKVKYAYIAIGDKKYYEKDGYFKLEYEDKCTYDKGVLTFKILSEKLRYALKNGSAKFYFTLADKELMLSGAKVTIKTEKGCSSCTIKTCKDYCKEKPIECCSYSQGRYFNRGNAGKHWPAGIEEVKVGCTTLRKGVDTLPATTPERRALFQAATLILSAQEQGIPFETFLACLPKNVKDAYNCIVQYNSNCNGTNSVNNTVTCDLQNAASTIGEWIDANHCLEE